MNFPSCFSRLAILVAALAAGPALPAADAPRGRPAGPGNQVEIDYSFSARNDLALGTAPGGRVGVDAVRATWSSGLPVGPATRLRYGVDWQRFAFDRSGPMAVPDHLQELALNLGAVHRVNPRWLLIASVRPGLYGDGEASSGDAFQVPALLLATFRQNPELAWSFGLRVDGFADNPVIPFVGVTWKFAPAWEFVLGAPRAGVTYAFSPALKFGFGATVQGGNFRVGRDPRPVSIAVGPRLDDTYLDYHEIRIGLAADYALNPSFTLKAEVGLITDQKFDYYDRNFTLNGDSAAFFSVGLVGRF